jgi:hypothetical protein
MFTLRSALVAMAVALTAATGLTAATIRGETMETSLDQACAHAAWPMIPAQCLDGAAPHAVRYALGGEATGTAMAERFAAAFR